MNAIPDLCLQYTAVFTVLKLEMGIALAIGVVIGYCAERWRR